MYYLVYKITNLVNNKIYIGKHKTENLNDNYFGSGKILLRALKKYGRECFLKEILYVCKTEKAMLYLEKSLVNDKFIIRDDVYNIATGGQGGNLNGKNIGPNHVSKTHNNLYFKKLGKKGADSLHATINNDTLFKEKYINSVKEGLKNFRDSGGYGGFKNRKHTEKFKKKLSKIMRIKQKGKKNSHFGKIWIYNTFLKMNKSIKKEDLKKYITDGWIKGRKMIFD